MSEKPMTPVEYVALMAKRWDENGIPYPSLQERLDIAEAIRSAVAEARAEEREAWKKLVDGLESLLICYRIGKNPGALLDRIEAARAAYRAGKEGDK